MISQPHFLSLCFSCIRGSIETLQETQWATPMFTSGDSLAGCHIQRTSTHRLRIIIQLNSVVLARKKTASIAHVLQNVTVRVMMLNRFPMSVVKVARKTIPPTYRGCI